MATAIGLYCWFFVSSSLRTSGRLMELGHSDGKLHVHYDDRLVTLIREVRQLSGMGYSVPAKIQQTASTGRKFYKQAVILKQVTLSISAKNYLFLCFIWSQLASPSRKTICARKKINAEDRLNVVNQLCVHSSASSYFAGMESLISSIVLEATQERCVYHYVFPTSVLLRAFMLPISIISLACGLRLAAARALLQTFLISRP